MPGLDTEQAVAAFKKAFGAGERYADYTPDTERRLSSRIPGVMSTILKQDGFCSCKKQVLWLCDPDEWRTAATAWFPEPSDPVALARSAFGDLFVLVGQTIFHALVHESTVIQDVSDANWFFGFSMTQKEFATQTYLPGRVRGAVKLAGKLAADEMYTYVPALQMGGSPDTSSVQRVKAREQLVMLSQLDAIRRMF